MDAMRYDFVAILMNYLESFVLFHIAAERQKERARGRGQVCLRECVRTIYVCKCRHFKYRTLRS